MKITDATIFVVEDDASIRFGLEEVLKNEGFAVRSCGDGKEALRSIGETLPDLIVLDVMLPGASGYEIARKLREGGCRIPVLMLTAKGQEVDKVVGLNAGADDYVTKPFGVNELLARIQALLRRAVDWSGNPRAGGKRLEVGRAVIDCENYEAAIDGTSVALTPRELELIRFLDAHRGAVLSRDRILEEVWGVRYFGTTRTLDQCVAQVRKKIGDDGRTPDFLFTVHGVGYKLA
ncbi:MAG: response regulator transcription factor [Verrucomicrobiales bacterium]